MTAHARSPRRHADSALVAVSFLLLAVPAMPAAAQERPPLIYSITLEQLEYRAGDETDLLTWDGDLVVGTDEWKLRLQSEAEYDRSDSGFETLENQLLVQRPLWDFFDVKAGLRFDTPTGPNRVYGVLGLQGLAPQWFEVDADLFLSERGDASMRLDVEYELLFTNRLILTPSAEVGFAFSNDREMGSDPDSASWSWACGSATTSWIVPCRRTSECISSSSSARPNDSPAPTASLRTVCSSSAA